MQYEGSSVSSLFIILYSSLRRFVYVIIYDKLNFTSHISELSTKASQNVGVLVRLRNLIPCNTKLSLYKSSNLLPFSLPLLQRIGSEDARADSGASTMGGL